MELGSDSRSIGAATKPIHHTLNHFMKCDPAASMKAGSQPNDYVKNINYTERERDIFLMALLLYLKTVIQKNNVKKTTLFFFKGCTNVHIP